MLLAVDNATMLVMSSAPHTDSDFQEAMVALMMTGSGI